MSPSKVGNFLDLIIRALKHYLYEASYHNIFPTLNMVFKVKQSNEMHKMQLACEGAHYKEICSFSMSSLKAFIQGVPKQIIIFV